MKRKSNGRVIAATLIVAILFSLMSILTGCQRASSSGETSAADVPKTDISSADTGKDKQVEPKEPEAKDTKPDKEEVMTSEQKELYLIGFEFGESICVVSDEAMLLYLQNDMKEEQYRKLSELRNKIFYEVAEDREALAENIQKFSNISGEGLSKEIHIEIPDEFSVEGFQDADFFYTNMDLILMIALNKVISEKQYMEFVFKASELREDISSENVDELAKCVDALFDDVMSDQLEQEDFDQSEAGGFI